MEDPPELTIEKLFTQPIQKPFSYDLKLGQNEEQITVVLNMPTTFKMLVGSFFQKGGIRKLF